MNTGDMEKYCPKPHPVYFNAFSMWQQLSGSVQYLIIMYIGVHTLNNGKSGDSFLSFCHRGSSIAERQGQGSQRTSHGFQGLRLYYITHHYTSRHCPIFIDVFLLNTSTNLQRKLQPLFCHLHLCTQPVSPSYIWNYRSSLDNQSTGITSMVSSQWLSIVGEVDYLNPSAAACRPTR